MVEFMVELMVEPMRVARGARCTHLMSGGDSGTCASLLFMVGPQETVDNDDAPGGALTALCQPAPVLATLVLVINDHALKGGGVVPGAITGKLSDMAGLFLFPILLAALARVALLRATGSRAVSGRLYWRWLPALSAGVTLLGFTALKTWPGFNRLVESFWGQNILDPGDLLASPMVGLAWWWLRAYDTRTVTAHRPGRVAQITALAVAAFACLATSPPRMPRMYPMWRVEQTNKRLACALVTPGVSKSGKTGVGLTLAVRGQGPGICRVQVNLAALNLMVGSAGPEPADGPAVSAVRAHPQVSGVEVGAGQVAHIYLPFLFDNNRAWNNGLRRGFFQIRLTIDDQAQPEWHIPAEHQLDGYHYGDRWRRTGQTQPYKSMAR